MAEVIEMVSFLVGLGAGILLTIVVMIAMNGGDDNKPPRW